MKTYVAGIVTYNPDIERLENNVRAIIGQISSIVIVDNGSDNIVELKELLERYNNVEVICNKKNLGIAHALNQICGDVINKGAKWCLLLDQDSICSDNIISEYAKYVDEDDVGILSPYIIDEYKIPLDEYKKMKLSDSDNCKFAITSGSFVNLSVWGKVGGFWDELFIDGVDSEYSYKVRCNGYKILRINNCYIMHQQGNKTEKTHIYRVHKDMTGKKTIKPAFRFNYSQTRWYYMARNNMIIIRKYRKLNGIVKPLIRYVVRFMSVIMIERKKIKVIRAILKGFIEGIKYEVVPVIPLEKKL